MNMMRSIRSHHRCGLVDIIAEHSLPPCGSSAHHFMHSDALNMAMSDVLAIVHDVNNAT